MRRIRILVGNLKKEAEMKEQREDRVLSNGEIKEEVLEEAFKSVGYFFWPLYFHDELADYVISLSTLISKIYYQKEKDSLIARGLILLSALKDNHDLKMCNNCPSILNIICDDASRANAESAMIVRMFIENRNDFRLREFIENIWSCYQEDENFFRHKYDE